MELWELSARESIRDLIARYNANGDAGRWDELEKLFTPDAVLDVDGRVYEGRPAVMGLFRSVSAGSADALADADVRTVTHTTMEEWLGRGHKPFLRHFTATTQIDVVSETRAKARSYYFVMCVHGLDHWGRYVDDFARVDGRWLFARRQESMDAAYDGGWGMGQATDMNRVVRGLGSAAAPL